MDNNALALKKYFENKPGIPMAFLFGSTAKGRGTKDSDADVAVWFDKPFSLGDADKIRSDVENIVNQNVDLVVLNNARPTIAWAAMRGKPLIIKDAKLYLRKVLEVSTEAEDMQDLNIEIFNLRQKLKKEAQK